MIMLLFGTRTNDLLKLRWRDIEPVDGEMIARLHLRGKGRNRHSIVSAECLDWLVALRHDVAVFTADDDLVFARQPDGKSYVFARQLFTLLEKLGLRMDDFNKVGILYSL